MAGAAVLIDFEEQGVTIAVDKPTQDLLRVAAGLTFFPELLAGTAPVVHVARLDRVLEGVFVHPSHHEYATPSLGALLYDRGDEATVVIFEIQLHGVISEAMGSVRKKILERRFSIAKGAAIREDQGVSVKAPNETRFRYREVAPEHLTVLVSELLEKLPDAFYKKSETKEGSIDLPCRDLLAGNTPRLSLGQLNQLLPDIVVIPEGVEESHQLNLPAGWVARHYRLVITREEIPHEKGEAEQKDSLPATPSEDSQRIDFKERVNEAPVFIEAEVVLPRPSPPLHLEEMKAAQGEPASTTTTTDTTTTIIEVEDPKAKEQAKTPPKRSIFASLPIFRRHQPEIVTRNPMESPASAPLEQKREEETDFQKTPVTEGKSDSSAALTLERLWKFAPEDQLADPTSLQALFMTEERLTLDRVIEMAGQLPGLRACVLAHGEKVICASETPAGMDLQFLSSQAMTMLAQIRDSSITLGLGAVPAITLHAEQGALSFLHNGELCLLVLHTERGFVPGVRERLQEMLQHLANARPALSQGEERKGF